MAELSEDEKQSLDDALSTLDDLYEATLKPDGGFRSEQMEAIVKLAEEAMGCVLSVLDPEMYDAVQRDCSERKLGREARAVRTLTLLDEVPARTLMLLDEVPHGLRPHLDVRCGLQEFQIDAPSKDAAAIVHICKEALQRRTNYLCIVRG